MDFPVSKGSLKFRYKYREFELYYPVDDELTGRRRVRDISIESILRNDAFLSGEVEGKIVNLDTIILLDGGIFDIKLSRLKKVKVCPRCDVIFFAIDDIYCSKCGEKLKATE